jgi:hypothetical protein
MALEDSSTRSLCDVVRNAVTFIAAPSDHMLFIAAARRSALTRKRKPFPYIFGNTSANNKAAAECAQPICCSQLLRSLHILGHVPSAVKHHARQELEQRHLPPALGRVAGARLPYLHNQKQWKAILL